MGYRSTEMMSSARCMPEPEEKSESKPTSTIINHTILIVGPMPPPIGGSGLTVQSIFDELSNYGDINVLLVNTSPLTDPRKKMTGINREKISRMWNIMVSFAGQILHADTVVTLANNLFSFTMAPILLLIAKYHRKPFYLKPVGGDLDAYLSFRWKPVRSLMVKTLRLYDGIFAQTQMLKKSLNEVGCNNVHYLPGCRSRPAVTPMAPKESQAPRLIFLGHITRDKGALILLQALQILSGCRTPTILCDFYGLVNETIREQFFSLLHTMPNVCFRGVAKPGTGTNLISRYDVLVLPTNFICEGHPGVIIEAMHAGIPVISTRHRAIPELIEDGKNGILVPPQNPNALATAIERIVHDSILRKKMGQSNYRMGAQFCTEIVVPRMLEILFSSPAGIGDRLPRQRRHASFATQIRYP